MLKGGEFILQAIGSMFEMLVMTECECIYYRFISAGTVLLISVLIIS